MSPDFFSFFSQTVRLLEEDPSIYCISAWNDQVLDLNFPGLNPTQQLTRATSTPQLTPPCSTELRRCQDWVGS